MPLDERGCRVLVDIAADPCRHLGDLLLILFGLWGVDYALARGRV